MLDTSYELFLAMLGFGILAAAIAPPLMRRLSLNLPLSLPIACLAGGILVGNLFVVPHLDVIAQGAIVQRVTELAVILSLTGGGLKIDRAFNWRGWGSAWRLLGITMPLSIALLALAGWLILGLPGAVALLLAACMAPTDPVLAASVQVGPPGQEEKEDEARFALTAEAGLNDGAAFPFVHLALAAAAAFSGNLGTAGDAGQFTGPVIATWFTEDVLWKIVSGTVVGVLIGWLLGWVVFRLAPRRGVADAFLAVGLTLFTYGLTEVTVHGYGFIAVFVAALSFRRFERHHELHSELHHFVEQTETLFLVAVMFVTGIAIAQGLLAPLDWRGYLVAALFLLAIRPVAGWVALAGARLPTAERFAVSALGIRGVGSFYYLAYGLAHAPFSVESGRTLWALAGLIVAASVVLHGLTAPRIMAGLERGTQLVGTRIRPLLRRRGR
ncbi:sodium:proton antiporter [Paracoccus suum]|uniref:Sodium:proton antiporter n=1 Tax=Paracoccus suum TaxID=2259340 RepID=A0A344PMH3_9RHOB|nr:cation:proton antiporter [Paracoccus suum]AXC50578.1 sodium:proton antiporter [Paracoccus suum]